MSQPDQIQVESISGGLRFVLPVREDPQNGPGTCGCVLIGFSLFGFVFMLIWLMVGFFGEGLLSLIFALVALPALIFSAMIGHSGLNLLKNRCHTVVELNQSHLLYREHGLRFVRFKRNRDRINRIILQSGVGGGRRISPATPGSNVACLQIVSDQKPGKPMMAAPMYSPDILRELGRLLVDELNESLRGSLSDGGRHVEFEDQIQSPGADVLEDGAIDSDLQVDTELPESSSLIVEEKPYGFTLIVPPAGIVKGSHGMFWGALIFELATILFTVGFMYKSDSSKLQAGFLLFISFFHLVGLGMMFSSWVMGRRKSILAIADRQLAFVRMSPLGSQTKEFAADEIRAVRVGPSGLSINDIPVQELKLIDQKGQSFGLLAQCSDEELDWIAGRIRQALG